MLLKANLSDIVDELLGNTCGSQMTGLHWYSFEHFIHLFPLSELFYQEKNKQIYIEYHRDTVKGLFAIKQQIRNPKRITQVFFFNFINIQVLFAMSSF